LFRLAHLAQKRRGFLCWLSDKQAALRASLTNHLKVAFATVLE
jgi:hypothetical protein